MAGLVAAIHVFFDTDKQQIRGCQAAQTSIRSLRKQTTMAGRGDYSPAGGRVGDTGRFEASDSAKSWSAPVDSQGSLPKTAARPYLDDNATELCKGLCSPRASAGRFSLLGS
jgi:hypothetical protein